MHIVRLRQFRSVMLACLLAMSHAVNADDVVTVTVSKDRPSLVNIVGPEGFITQLQTVDSGTLADQLQELRSSLISRKQELARELDEKQLDSGDAVLTLLMPGGLIYAGYKKAVYERARNDLAKVNENIAEYSRDLALLQGKMRPVAVARRK